MNDVKFSPDGSMLATAGDDGLLKVWDPETGELIFEVQGGGRGGGLSFDADGSARLRGLARGGTVRVVEVATGHVVQELTASTRSC